MLFPEEDSPLLKAWIVKRLENTLVAPSILAASPGYADVLADFVLALLHHDDGSEDVKSKCMSEMGNFLTEDPSSFVNDLFEIIQYRSYVPGAAPPPKAVPAAAPPPALPSLGAPSTDQPVIPTGPGGGNARKRGFHDRGDFDAPTGRDQFPGGRPYKQPRRGGGRRGYVDPDRPQPMSPDQYPFQNTSSSFAQPGQVPQMPQFDPSNPLEAMRQLQQISQQMGLSMQPFADYSQQHSGFQQNAAPQQGKKGRCWDFDRKGFCPRGLKCKFDHSTGPEPVYSLPTPQLSGQIQLPGEGWSGSRFPSTPIKTEELGSSHDFFATPFGVNPFFVSFNDYFNPPTLTQQAEYDPTSATMSQPQQPAPFQEGPVYDRSQTKVVVESIPEENFDEDQVRNFFAQFGNVEQVTMMAYKRLAIVKYDNWASANAAYKSPKVIFDNRFVKVYWYKEEKHGDVANGGNGANGFKNGHSANSGKREESADVKMEEIDMEEFTRKQEEAQKLHEEKMAKIREIEKQREELEKKQKELQAKQAAEKQRLLEKLAGSRKNSNEVGTGGGDAAAEGKGGEASKTEALKATLEKLRGEAAALGIDPNAQQDDSSAISTSYIPSYGRGGRGGYYRGRGAYPPRGSFRGGARGGRGNFHAAYAAFSLDNRPKTVAISGLDFSAPEKDEALRRHLFGFQVHGEGVAEIQTTPTVTHVSFGDRKSAEAFYNSVKNNKIPGINDGPVELSWVAGAAAPLPGSTTSNVDLANGGAGVGPTDGGGLDSAMGDADGGDDNNQHHHDGDGKADQDGAAGENQQHAQQQQEPGEAKAEVDYDVAGENEWDE
ncbi:hypothetical protein J7T55_014292 [Diaporthe amygdali]|uniref:uncharacterized protein n=1 Tax=Phomopsis amygdali TaxID=1214568 RepID=UPI0022FDE22C|nr:uncharacterized protein J7T55_014292 [Diaporthe amygdali]KAJ0117843.1 hypothetical protein J7T55_014292 [Diaporthe amygdali]